MFNKKQKYGYIVKSDTVKVYRLAYSAWSDEYTWRLLFTLVDTDFVVNFHEMADAEILLKEIKDLGVIHATKKDYFVGWLVGRWDAVELDVNTANIFTNY